MKRLFTGILLLVSIAAFAQAPDTLTPEKNARYKIGRIRDNTIRAITPADFRAAFKSVVDLAVKRVPFLSQAELRSGKADTASIVQVVFNNTTYRFQYDPASAAADDSATVLVTGTRRYVIVSDVLTPQMFGVNANGASIVTEQVAKAIRKSVAMKKPLYFPEGVYPVALDFYNLNGVTLMGAGKGSILRMPNAQNKTILKMRSCSNITIKDLAFDGNKANNPTRQTADVGENNVNDNIYISKGDNIRITYTYHTNSTGNGVNMYRVTGYHVDYNYFDGCNALDQNAITVQFGTTSEVIRDNGGSISFNKIKNNPGGMALSCFSSHETTIDGNVIEDCIVGIGLEYGASKNRVTNNIVKRAGKGVVVTSTADLTRIGEYNIVSNNQFLECSGLSVGTATGMVQLGGQRYLKFLYNFITGASGNTVPGVHASYLHDCSVKGNDVSGAGSHGIVFIATANVSIKNDVIENKVYNNSGSGLFFASVNRTQVARNRIWDNVTGMTFGSSSKLTIDGNFIFGIAGTQGYAMIIQDCSEITEGTNTFSFNNFQPDVHVIGTNSNHFVGNRINYARTWVTAVPTSGTWGRGDVVYNSSPTYGKPLSWRCVTAGTPGTWVINQIMGATSLHVTAAEKAALTPADGDRVYQTDATKGEYVYITGTGWVAM